MERFGTVIDRRIKDWFSQGAPARDIRPGKNGICRICKSAKLGDLVAVVATKDPNGSISIETVYPWTPSRPVQPTQYVC